MTDAIPDNAARLEKYSLFKGVSGPDREELVNVMQRKHYAKGDVLFKRGDPGDSMFIILNGRVRIYTQDADGNEFTFRYLSEMFGEFAMLDSRPRSASADAADDLEVLILHRDDFTQFLHERPVVGLSLMQNLVERVRYTTIYLQQVVNATNRLAHGDYDYSQNISGSETGSAAEIQELIGAFIHMVQGVQSREQVLQQAFKGQEAQLDSTGHTS